jgi:hypothetical protein
MCTTNKVLSILSLLAASAAFIETAFADRGENGISVPNRFSGLNVLGKFGA